MKRKSVEVHLTEGVEVHGPDGWIALKGDCTVMAELDVTGHELHYVVNNDDWWVPKCDVMALS